MGGVSAPPLMTYLKFLDLDYGLPEFSLLTFPSDRYARKIHYTCDLFFALSWALVTGFNSPFPWFYPLFFAIMITHRALRDIQRCRVKYGEAWKQYEKTVPYIFIPVSRKSVFYRFPLPFPFYFPLLLLFLKLAELYLTLTLLHLQYVV